MRDFDQQVRQLAGKYVWWREPGNVPHDTRRLIAQVMDLGTHEDAEAVREHAGDEVLREILQNAAPGWFSGKSWHYWHYALGLAAFGQVPEQPIRRFI